MSVQRDHSDQQRGESTRLFQSLYGELRSLAGHMLNRQSPDHTLQPTALVHEAFLKLSASEKADWKSRSHFFAAGAGAMRQILVDHARSHLRQKRGGGRKRVELNEELLSVDRDDDVLLVDSALTELARLNERQSKIVEMRFFGGLTEPEMAEALGVSERTVQREWYFCRAWLRNHLQRELQA